MLTTLFYVIALSLILMGALVRPRLAKQSMMLAAGYIFYATWGAGFLAILIASSVLNFVLGKWLRKEPTSLKLWTGVVANILLLGFFKYLPPLAPSFSSDFFQSIVMPVGMSFWTFQALSYLFDVYREEDVDPTLLEFCLYMSFWPTVVMGPVCRLTNLLPQLREVHGFSSNKVTAGLTRIATGLFMKLILAQFLGSALAEATATGPAGATALGGLDVWFIALGFGFQLFFDFAGYSNIVIGAAQIFGFTLEENFDSPYLATTPSMFWTKWHMSLSSWIRDYVFVPAATARREMWWRYFAVFFPMVLFGLWHGATLTFLLWGVYQGLLLVTHRLGQQYQRKLNLSMDGMWGSLLSWALTFTAMTLGWVLFRTNDLGEAAAMFGAILSPASYASLALPAAYYRAVLFLVIGYFSYCGLTSELVEEKWNEFLSRGAANAGRGRQLLQFSWENRWWWLAPMLATVAIFSGLAVLYQSSRVTPFIYTLF